MITFVSLGLICNATRVIDVIEHLSRGMLMVENIYQKRIRAWTRKYGKLAPEIQRKIDMLVAEYDLTQNVVKTSKDLGITNGTQLIREFNGKSYSVLVLTNGYEFNGKKYKSLSAIANEITGTHWNGKRFFGVA